MNTRIFLKLVELPTKVTCFTTFLLSTLYILLVGAEFKWLNFLYMFISLIAMDMVTTGLNNYIDYKKARKKTGFGYEEHNAIVKYGLKESTVVITLLIISLISIIFGILLFLQTDIIVLLIGIISFGVGVIYTYGPVPISRTPLGEIFSGLFQGFGIIFLGIYIHVFDQNMVSFFYNDQVVNIGINIVMVGTLFIFALPSTLTIANIMLANNICDMEDDWINKRYTLPIYIGKEFSLQLFAAGYYVSYLVIIIMVFLKLIPLISLLTLLTIFIVYRNIKLFNSVQRKKDTFQLSIMNFILINGGLLLTIGTEVILNIVF
jgi:1,4-dihydroxy-2-naphthoate octaprenyltransferase